MEILHSNCAWLFKVYLHALSFVNFILFSLLFLEKFKLLSVMFNPFTNFFFCFTSHEAEARWRLELLAKDSSWPALKIRGLPMSRSLITLNMIRLSFLMSVFLSLLFFTSFWSFYCPFSWLLSSTTVIGDNIMQWCIILVCFYYLRLVLVLCQHVNVW